MSTNHQFDLTILKFAAKQQQTRMTVNNEVQEQWSQWSGIRGLDTIEELGRSRRDPQPQPCYSSEPVYKFVKSFSHLLHLRRRYLKSSCIPLAVVTTSLKMIPSLTSYPFLLTVMS